MRGGALIAVAMANLSIVIAFSDASSSEREWDFETKSAVVTCEDNSAVFCRIDPNIALVTVGPFESHESGEVSISISMSVHHSARIPYVARHTIWLAQRNGQWVVTNYHSPGE